MQASRAPNDRKLRHSRDALKAAALSAVINTQPLPQQSQGEPAWQGGPVRWPRRNPEPIIRAVTRLNGPRLAGLAAFAAAVVSWLSVLCGPVRQTQGGGTTFGDVTAAMPDFADYALAVMMTALVLALFNTIYAAFYWPRRVRINRSGQYMTVWDRYRINLAATPWWIVSMALCYFLYMWLSGRLDAGV